jgi:hypothetical protein
LTLTGSGFKSEMGIKINQTPHELSSPARAREQSSRFVGPMPARDPRFSLNSFVVSILSKIRFYHTPARRLPVPTVIRGAPGAWWTGSRASSLPVSKMRCWRFSHQLQAQLELPWNLRELRVARDRRDRAGAERASVALRIRRAPSNTCHASIDCCRQVKPASWI